MHLIGNVSVIEREGEFFVTSLQVAEHFGREHYNVMRDIKNLDCSEKFNTLNFEGIELKDGRGRSQKACLMSKDGFSFLAMGFTGKLAAEWKEKYIHAFNEMEKALYTVGGAAWLQKRIEGKFYRKPLTDAIQKFVNYAVSQGSETYKKAPQLAYIQFTKMEYKALFLLSKSVTNLRDSLSMMDLNMLSQAELITRKCLNDCMEKSMFYKDIYQEAKKKVLSYAEMVGPSDQAVIQGNPFLLLMDDKEGEQPCEL